MGKPKAKPETAVNFVVGPPDDDCAICRATREGKTVPEIIAGIKAGTIKGNAVILETEEGI